MTATLVLLFLVALNALYVVAEFAAVSIRATQLQPVADGGDRRAAGLLAVLRDDVELDRYVAACQIGITLASLISGAYSQAVVSPALAGVLQSTGLTRAMAHSVAAGAVLVALTVAQVLFGELIPKALTLQFPLQTALLTYRPMRLSLKLYRGFLAVLNGSAHGLLGLFGVKPGSHHHVHSPEELDLLMAESRKEGVLAPEQHEQLHGVLTLGQRSAQDLMIPISRVRSLELTATAEEVLREISSSPYSRLPVHASGLDHTLGLVHTKDVATHFARHGSVPPLRQLLRPLPRVEGHVSADRLLEQLRKLRASLALVVAASGHVEGLISLDDVLASLLGQLGDELKPAGGHTHA